MDDSFLDWETRNEQISFRNHIIAGMISFMMLTFIGSCAGVMEHVGMFPLDTIKVSNIFNLTTDSNNLFNYRLIYKQVAEIWAFLKQLQFFTKMKDFYDSGKEHR